MEQLSKALLLIAFGVGGTIAAQHYLAAPARKSEPARRIEQLELPERSYRRAPPSLPKYAPRQEKISARFVSLAEQANDYISRYGHPLMNGYFGGNSVTYLEPNADVIGDAIRESEND